jgi:hypothetical protein
LSASPAISTVFRPLVAHLPQQERGLLVVAADKDEIDIVALEPRDDGGEVVVALVVGLVELFGDAGLVERLLGLVGQALAVGGLVVEDRDVLAGEVLGDELPGDGALLVVAAADAQHVPQLALGEDRVGGGWRDLQHVRLGVSLGSRDR